MGIQEFIKKANTRHNNKYDYTLVEYINNKVPIVIVCKIHGEFLQRPDCHLRKNPQGCPKCANKKPKEINKENLDKEFEKLKNKSVLIHDNKYDYSKTKYLNKFIPITIMCPIHREFNQSMEIHSKGHGCKKCGYELSSNKKKQNKENLIIKLNNIHSNKYDYTILEYSNNLSNVDIICKKHGKFTQILKNHISGMGCSKCSNNNKFNKQHFLDRSKEVHQGKYEYNLPETFNNLTKIEITCKKHGIFIQKISNHLNNQQGCPSCSNSKGEIQIENILNKYNIQYEKEKKFEECKNRNKLRFDFFLPKHNMCIEFDGIQHEKPIEKFGGIEYFNYIKLTDQIKNTFCIDNNIKLIRIKYKEYKNIENIILNII